MCNNMRTSVDGNTNPPHRMTIWFDIHRLSPAAGFVVLLLTLFVCSGAVAAEPKRVMLLHSFGRDFKPWSEYAKSIRAELDRQSPWRLDITDHSLVSARSSDEDSERPFVDYLHALFAKQPPRLDRQHRRASGCLRSAAPAAPLHQYAHGVYRRRPAPHSVFHADGQ